MRKCITGEWGWRELGGGMGRCVVPILNKIGTSFVEKLIFEERCEGIRELAYGYPEERLSKQRGQPAQRP